MPQLTIIRGLPGSGKTTLAKILANATGATHLEVDQYWVNENGEYNYDRSKLYVAIGWYIEKYTEVIVSGKDLVVSNCHFNEHEIDPISELAEANGYTVQLIECKSNFGTVHNVDADMLDCMWRQWVQIKPAHPCVSNR